MKLLILILPLLLMLGCKDDKYKSKEADEKHDNKPAVQQNNPPAEPDYYIAWRDEPGGPVYIRETDEDIDKFIVDLRPLNVDVQLLDRNYWRDNKCRRMSARKCVVGDCVAGNCEQVLIGNWNVCRCRL